MDAYRLVVGAVLISILFLVLSWLEGRFDSSDHVKAIEIVSNYKPRTGGKSLERAILERHPGVEPDEVSWSSEITSSCLGHVRVYARIPKKGDVPAETLAFDVDLNGPSVHPTDEKTIAILRSLTSTTAAGRTGRSTTYPPP